MGKKLYIGNLSYSVDSNHLQSLFSEFGTVDSANVIMDRNSGRSKGFGFVEMSTENAAETAISAMNGKDVSGREMNVSIAKPQAPRKDFGARRRY